MLTLCHCLPGSLSTSASRKQRERPIQSCCLLATSTHAFFRSAVVAYCDRFKLVSFGLCRYCLTQTTVKFKVVCLVRQLLFGQSPLYLADDCCLMSDRTRRSLRSADVPTCVVPRTLSSYSNRTFAASGPRLWNSLLVQLHNQDITYALFRQQLKGHLFRKAQTKPSVTSICGALKTLTDLLTYRKNSNIIRTFVQYAPQTLMGELWENVSLSV